MEKLHCEMVDTLFKAIMSLETLEECYNFFEDICTVKEIFDMSQRFEVARCLQQGKSYVNISALTGASTATISRVNKCLSYGSGGYKLAIERIKKGNADE